MSGEGGANNGNKSEKGTARSAFNGAVIGGFMMMAVGGAGIATEVQNDYLAPPEQRIEHHMQERESGFFGVNLETANNEANALMLFSLGGVFFIAGMPRRRDEKDPSSAAGEKPTAPRDTPKQPKLNIKKFNM